MSVTKALNKVALWALLAIAIIAIGGVAYLYINKSGQKYFSSVFGERIGSDETSEEVPITLAFAGNLTRIGGPDDVEVLEGVRMYVDAVNASGGIDGRPVALEEYDDRGEVEFAREIAVEIAQSDAVAVLGHGAGETARAAAEIYARLGIPYIAPSTTDPTVTLDNPFAFRVIFTSALQAKILANYVRSVLGYESTAIVRDDSERAQVLTEAFSEAAEEIALNVSPVFTLSDAMTDVQIADIVRRLRLMTGLESILLALDPAKAQVVATRLRRAGSRADLIGTDTLTRRALGDVALLSEEEMQNGAMLAPFLEEMLIAVPFVPDTASLKATEFLDEYRAKVGTEGNWPALFGRDAAHLVLTAFSRDASDVPPEDIATARERVREGLAAMEVPEAGTQGLTGQLYFGPEGDVIRPVLLGRVDHGKIETASRQLQVVEDPAQVELLREQGEDTIEVEDVFLQVIQVVRTGIHLRHLGNIDTQNNTFEADFDIWFRYTGDFDAKQISFTNSVEPIVLDEPAVHIELRHENYELYSVSGKFEYAPDIKSLRSSHQDFQIGFQHARRDVSRLVFLPDLRAIGAEGGRQGWADALRRRNTLDASSGWVISDAVVAQEVQNESTRGNPLVPTIEVPFSAFLASVEAYQGEFSLRRQLGDLMPDIGSLIVLAALVLTVAATFERRLRSHFPRVIFFLRLVLTAMILIIAEDLVFEKFGDSLEIFQLTTLVNVFRALWWFAPAAWLILLIRRAVWEPMERRTGYPVPSIARLFVNFAIIAVAAICVMAFVFDFSLTSIWAASGVVTIVLGIALQTLILDAATGLMINMERPYRLGEWVKIDGVVGKVTEMNWRTTRIWTLLNNMVIVPNSRIGSSSLINYSDPSQISAVEIKIRLPFDTPFETVSGLLKSAANEAAEAGLILTDPGPSVFASVASGDGILYTLEVCFTVQNGEWSRVETYMVALIQRYLREAQIPVWDPDDPMRYRPLEPLRLHAPG